MSIVVYLNGQLRDLVALNCAWIGRTDTWRTEGNETWLTLHDGGNLGPVSDLNGSPVERYEAHCFNEARDDRFGARIIADANHGNCLGERRCRKNPQEQEAKFAHHIASFLFRFFDPREYGLLRHRQRHAAVLQNLVMKVPDIELLAELRFCECSQAPNLQHAEHVGGGLARP